MCSSAAPGGGGEGGPGPLPSIPPRPTTTTTTGSSEVKMRRFTLPNLFLTVEGQDRQLEEICPGIYEYTGHPRSPRSPRSPKSPRSPRSTKSTSPNSPRAPHCQCQCPRLHRQDDLGSSSASPSPRRKRPPYSHILLGERKPSAGNLLATTFGIADRDAPTQSLPKIHEKEKEHARLVVERPEIKDTQAGFEALGGRCESCGSCMDSSCLKKLGLEHEDGSRSPSSISPKSEKMYTFFEKSLSLVSPSPTRFGDHLVPREKRSHSLATPAAMANVVHFQELHSRHAESHLLRTANMAASNAVLSRISARLKAVTPATQQESVEEVDEEVEAQAAANTPDARHHQHHSNHHHSHGHHSGATTPQDTASPQKKPHTAAITQDTVSPTHGSNAQADTEANAGDTTGEDTLTQPPDGNSPSDDAPSPGSPGKEEGLEETRDKKSKTEDEEDKEEDEANETKSRNDTENLACEVNDMTLHAEEEEATPETQSTDEGEPAT